MAWVGPAIMAGGAVVNWIKNKKQENAAKKDAMRQHDEYYDSPVMQALNAYLRNYWNEHGLAERAPGVSIDQLLTRPRFNDRGFKRPGAGSALGGGLLDALAAYYGGKGGTTKKPYFNPDWAG